MESPFVEGVNEESECTDQESGRLISEHPLRRWVIGIFFGTLIAILLAPLLLYSYRFRSPELKTYYQARKNENERTEKVQYYQSLCHFSSKQSANMSLTNDYAGRLPKIKCHGVSQDEAEEFVGSVLQNIPEKIADSISRYTVEVHSRVLKIKKDNTRTYGTHEQLTRNINTYYNREDVPWSISILTHEIGHAFTEQMVENLTAGGYYTAESLPLISFHEADNEYCHSNYQEFMDQYFVEFIYYNDNCKAASAEFYDAFSKAIDEYHYKWWHLV